MWMPSGSVSPVTLPNSVSTPTLPVGIDVVAPQQNQYDKDHSPSCKIREPATENWALTASSRPCQFHRARHIHHFSLPPSRSFRQLMPRAPLYHLLRASPFIFLGVVASNLPTDFATAPQHIVVFSLDSRTRKRQNPRQQPSVREIGSRATRPATHEARRPLRGNDMQFLPGFTVQCINPQCEARGHWLRADATAPFATKDAALLRQFTPNVPPPLGHDSACARAR